MDNVLIAVPTRGRIHYQTTDWLLKQTHRTIICYSVFGVVEARVKLVSHFLKNDFTHLFFLDDDIVPPLAVIETLLKDDWDINPADYLIKVGDEIKSCIGRNYCGLGACLIRRKVLEAAFPEDYFKLSYDSEGNVVIGEDVAFCNKAQSLGFTICLTPQIECEHYKEIPLNKFLCEDKNSKRSIT